MQIITILILMLVASIVQAADNAHGGGIPTASVLWQCLNLGLVILIIYFATRKTLPELFRQRQAGYVASAKKAEEAKIEAEKNFLDIKHKLDHLNTSYDETVSRAQAEAADLRKQILQEAQEHSLRVKEEAEMTVKIETQRAQRELHEVFVKESVSMARAVLSKDIASADHQKLQTEFTKNIEAVSP